MKPYNTNGSKKEEIRAMFNNIARTYDFLNKVLSLGIDRRWRKKVVHHMHDYQKGNILDIACGTGDMMIAELALRPSELIGLDLSKEMIKIAEDKMSYLRGVDSENILFTVGDSEALSFPENRFDAISVAFGVRNFENLKKGLCEMNRVLNVGGGVFILEFSRPTNFLVRIGYNIYSYVYLPLVGRIFSKDKSAYKYLPDSIREFPTGKEFLSILEECGFVSCKAIALTFGIATIYTGKKQ